jgi:hypothetical protein
MKIQSFNVKSHIPGKACSRFPGKSVRRKSKIPGQCSASPGQIACSYKMNVN